METLPRDILFHLRRSYFDALDWFMICKAYGIPRDSTASPEMLMLCACKNGDMKLFKWLLERNAFDDNSPFISMAAQHGHLELVRYMCETLIWVVNYRIFWEITTYGKCDGIVDVYCYLQCFCHCYIQDMNDYFKGAVPLEGNFFFLRRIDFNTHCLISKYALVDIYLNIRNAYAYALIHRQSETVKYIKTHYYGSLNRDWYRHVGNYATSLYEDNQLDFNTIWMYMMDCNIPINNSTLVLFFNCKCWDCFRRGIKMGMSPSNLRHYQRIPGVPKDIADLIWE